MFALIALVLLGILLLELEFVVAIASTIRFVLGWVFLSFELTAQVSIVTWLFSVVASWFGVFCVMLSGLFRHGIYLQVIWRFRTIQFQLPFKMWHNLFICAILQMRLGTQFFQVGRHFGI